MCPSNAHRHRLASRILILTILLLGVCEIAAAWQRGSCCANHGESCCVLCKLKRGGTCGATAGGAPSVGCPGAGEPLWTSTFQALRGVLELPPADPGEQLESGERLADVRGDASSFSPQPPTPPPRHVLFTQL